MLPDVVYNHMAKISFHYNGNPNAVTDVVIVQYGYLVIIICIIYMSMYVYIVLVCE